MDASDYLEFAPIYNKDAYVLHLFITGTTPRSMLAIDNIKKICEHYLKDRYTLEIFDVYQQPDLLKSNQVIAVPTLVKVFPLPTKKIIGDLNDSKKVLKGLGLAEA